jgi:hypothetical protein
LPLNCATQHRYHAPQSPKSQGGTKIMALPVAVSQPVAIPAIPLPIVPRFPVWPLFAIAAGLAASVAWTSLLTYWMIAFVIHAFS